MKTRKSLKRKILVTALASSLMMSSPLLLAQSAEAALRGKAPPDVEVSARNLATGLVRHTKAAADGSYALVGLPPGTYAVDAGPGTERTVTLSIASTATLDLAAAEAAKLEAITVVGSALTEVKTSEVGTSISLHQIQTIPQISRNFLEFADTVPGMEFNVDSKGHTSLRGGAQNLSSVNVFIDGVGQKSYVKEGGVSGQFFSQGNPFPQLAIGEYKVITSNYKAEYDQISSAAITAGTKSGTNEFHGDVFGTYTDDGWRNRTPAEEHSGKKTPSHEAEYGFAFGGPIIQDQLHFFLTYERKEFNTPTTVTEGVSGATPLLPADVQSQFGPAGLPFTEDLYFGKLDWEFSDRDRIEMSAKVRREDQTDNVGGQTAPSAGIDTLNDDDRYDARWQHSADRWFNELLYSYEKSFNNPTAFQNGNGAVYTTLIGNDDRTIIVSGAAPGPATQQKGQKGNALQDTLTFNNFDWHGDHVVKLGAKYKQVDLTAEDAVVDNPQFFYNVTPAGTQSQPYKVFFPAAAAGLSTVAKSSNDQFGAFIQDDWAVNDHLTLNLGLRWDYESTPAYEDYVTPANIVAALNSQNPHGPPGQTYAQALALGGIDLNRDYISNGHNRDPQKDQWAPRLGFSYDLGGDERHVIFGGAGRSYDRNLFDFLQLEQTKQALSTFNYYFQDANGNCYRGNNPCIPFDPRYLEGIENLLPLVAASNVGKEINLINNNIKTPYSDQFSIGMRNRVGDWNTSATVARILSKDGFAFTLGQRFPNGDFWASCGATCSTQPWSEGVPGFGNLIVGNSGIETRTTQLLLSAEKPYTRESGWAATFAYTYTDAKHNRDINEHYAFDEATIGDYPFILSNATSKHRFVATGAIDAPWGIVFAAKLTLATPIPVNQGACFSTQFPTGSFCTPIAGTVGSGNGVTDPNAIGAHNFIAGGDIFGYRQIDIQATKDIPLSHGTSMYVRFDLLNVFNYTNYSNYITNWTSNGVANSDPVAYNRIGDITGVPRTFKLSMGFRF